MRVFLAMPERALDEVAGILREAAETAGHEVLPDLPEARAGIQASERDRFLTTVDRLHEAELVLADVSEESHAVGWTVGWFLSRGRLVVLTCRRDKRAALSPMLVGNPSPWQRVLLYDGPEELRRGLAGLLRF